MISVPAGREFLSTPRRSRVLGVPPSIIHSTVLPLESLTSMWIHVWGLIHSTLVTVPRRLIGWVASNSDANAWCARSGVGVASAASALAATTSVMFLNLI